MGQPAQYPGTCEDCGEGIELDEEIEYDDDTGNWVHTSCCIAEILKHATDDDPRPRCPNCCDLIVNGKCRSCEV